jgi:hypothetical protein
MRKRKISQLERDDDETTQGTGAKVIDARKRDGDTSETRRERGEVLTVQPSFAD